MKWYSKDYRKMVNLDSIDGYVYIPSKEFIEQNPTDKDVQDFKDRGDRLELILSGTPYVFRGEDALEMYNMIEGNVRQILKD